MSTPEDLLVQNGGVDFFQLAKEEPSPRARMRLLALGHLKNGKSKQEIVRMFGVAPCTLRRWVLRFANGGSEKLKEQPGRGRKAKLSPEQEKEFLKEMERLRSLHPKGRVRAQDIQSMLKKKFSVDHALPSIYHLLARFGLSVVSGRSKHRKSITKAKKTSNKN